jgi:hypothetical protein
VGPRDGLDTVSKRKIPTPCRESNPDNLIVPPVALRKDFLIEARVGLVKVIEITI